MIQKLTRNYRERIYSNRNRLLWDEDAILSSYFYEDVEEELASKKNKKSIFSRRKKAKEVEISEEEIEDIVDKLNKANIQTIDYEDADRKENIVHNSKIRDENMDKNRKAWIRDNCKQIINANKIVDEAVVEYKVVCSYLNDVQKIELVEKNEKKKIIDTAKKLQKITQENERIKKRKQPKIKASQYAAIKKNENDMVDEIIKLEEYEKECRIIKSDLNKLEGERSSLNYERENLVSYQKFLKLFSKIAAIIFFLVYAVIGIVNFSTQVDMIIPLVIVTVFAISSMLYIVIVSRKNAYMLDVNEVKMNKLIMLFNKFKIKYFNSFNLVECVRSKYNVKNARELKHIWDKYIQEKEILNKHAKNEELYEVYENSLIKALARIKVEDTDIWTSQISAITNPCEMKEIKDKLDVRRQNLKHRIDYNNKLIEDGKKNIRSIIRKRTDYKDEVISILKTYNINI